MYISALLVCAAVVCVHAWLWIQGRRARRLLASLPSYTQLPFLGNVHKFFGGGKVILDRITELSNISEEENLPFVIWLGPRPAILLTDPDDVKTATNTFVDKPYYYNFVQIWLGNGLLTAPVPVWKRNIKKLSGAFSSIIVDGYQAVFNEQSQKLVDFLSGKVGSSPFNVMHELAYTTLEAICQTALGVPGISGSIVTDEYYQAFNRALELLIKRGLNLLMHFDTFYKMSPSYKEMVKCVGILHNLSETVINKRRKEWKAERQEDGDQEKRAESQTKFKSFMDILLELSESDPNLTLEQIKAEVNTIIVGGQETVASTLLYTLLLIGCKQDVQEKLYDEIKEIFGDSKRSVEKEDLARMTYCEAIICETLRLYPPAPVVMRYADKDLKIKSCTIPKGTGVGINVWGAGRARRSWGADALDYRPERWLEPDFARTHGSAFLAFSSGRRSCIGKKYAYALIKTVLVHCVREFKFSSEADKMRLRFDLVLRPVCHELLQIKLRPPLGQ